MSDEELYPTPDEYDDYTMKESPTYTPPKVWQRNQDEEKSFSKINRPIAGATHDKNLPVGDIRCSSLATPNGVKVTGCRGITGARHQRGRIRRGWSTSWRATSSPGLVGANPNSKIPALVDHSTPHPPECSSRQPSHALLKSMGSFYRLIERALNVSRCFGIRAVRPSSACSATFMPMRPSGSNTPLIASPWRSAAADAGSHQPSTICGDGTPSLTSRSTSVWRARHALHESGQFLDVNCTKTCSVGPKRYKNAQRLNAVNA